METVRELSNKQETAGAETPAKEYNMEKKKFSFPKSIVYLGRVYNLVKMGAKGQVVAVYESEDFGIRLTLTENIFKYHENCGNIERR